jgi:hypothetical protein
MITPSQELALVASARLLPGFIAKAILTIILGWKTREKSPYAPLAQLDRASVYGTEGCRFEPYGV